MLSESEASNNVLHLGWVLNRHNPFKFMVLSNENLCRLHNKEYMILDWKEVAFISRYF
jgi:hypothetical protein